jgi:hypothetical protein
MSKMDNLRARREARYQEMANRSAKAPARRPVAPSAASPAAVSPAKAEPEKAAPTDALCGHRNMGGKTCTREHGHAAKSHRYS